MPLLPIERTITSAPGVDPPGLAARRIAADILDGVLRRRRPLDEQLEDRAAHPELATLPERDRALVRAIVATVLRRLGTLRHLLGRRLERGLPADAPRVEAALLIGAAQILFLDVPDHAAVDLAVRLVQADRHAARYAGLVNAVLRRLARDGARDFAALDTAALDTPDWLMARWIAHYGAETARAIARRQRPRAGARSHREERSRSIGRARSAAACCRPARCARRVQGRSRSLPGYDDGAWWVQDAAAALPARLLGDVRGTAVADLCAAPGGKTAQLAAAGAQVTAVDRSPRAARAAAAESGPAAARGRDRRRRRHAMAGRARSTPSCSMRPAPSTGTIRRHPDIPWLKREADIAALAALQTRLLDRAAELTKPGGILVYCTCSLEPEEGDRGRRAICSTRNPDLRRQPMAADEVGGHAELAHRRTATCAPCPATCPTPIRAWPGSTASTPPDLRRI